MKISTDDVQTGVLPLDPDQVCIETNGLTKIYGDRPVVEQLTIQVPKSCVAAFVGPNGAGKSTTLRMLLGLVRPSSGSARVLGYRVSEPGAYLRKVGALIEGPAFYPTLSGRANLRVLASLGRLNERLIPEVLSLVGLEKRADDKVGKYSMGMKQRLGVAAALLPEPEVLILDEPANGLDPTGNAAMRRLLRVVADQGISVLVSSHQLADLQQVADWVIMINQGCLKYQGEIDRLLDRSGTTYLSPEDPADMDRLVQMLKENGYDPTAAGSHRIMMPLTHGSTSTINRMAMEAGITLSELHSTGLSLEDAYFALTDGGSIA